VDHLRDRAPAKRERDVFLELAHKHALARRRRAWLGEEQVPLYSDLAPSKQDSERERDVLLELAHEHVPARHVLQRTSPAVHGINSRQAGINTALRGHQPFNTPSSRIAW
jgi:hypothetical protein